MLYFSRQMYNHMKRAELSLVKISQKSWVAIPAQVRAKYHRKTGDRVKVVDYGGVVSLIPVLRRPEEDAMGASTQPGRSLTFSVINFGGVVYVTGREQGLQQAQRAIALIDQLAVHPRERLRSDALHALCATELTRDAPSDGPHRNRTSWLSP